MWPALHVASGRWFLRSGYLSCGFWGYIPKVPAAEGAFYCLELFSISID
jgi:hypothetical protein